MKRSWRVKQSSMYYTETAVLSRLILINVFFPSIFGSAYKDFLMNLDTPTPEKGEIVLQRSYCNDRVGNHLNGPSFVGQKRVELKGIIRAR